MEEIDNIELLIDNMKRQSHAMEYEEAQYILDKIKEELLKKESYKPMFLVDLDTLTHSFYDTIKDMYTLVTSYSIRLDMNDYDFVKFLDLLINLKKRKDELRGKRYTDINRQRRIVAEEMYKLEMPIKCKWKGIKPNRAFLDVAFKVNPFLCSNELIRRETVKMWKAVESKKESEKDKVRKELRKYAKRI